MSQAVTFVNGDNPFTFTSAQIAHTFVVGAQFPTEDATIQSVRPDNASSCQNFRIMASPVPARVCGGSAGSGCPLEYSFAVTYIGVGAESCIVDIDWSTGSPVALGGTITTQLFLNSNVSAPAMTVVPATIDFGQIVVGTTSSVSEVTLTNTGTVALFVSGMKVGPNPGAFTVTPVPPAMLGSNHMLNVGSAETFQVTCTPPSGSTFMASLQFTANAGTIMKSSNFTCQGVMSSLTVTPTQITFPSRLVGRSPPDQTVRIVSSGPAMLSSVSLDATAQGNNVRIASAPPLGTQLSQGISITLHYEADMPHSAGLLGKLIVKSSADPIAREIAISGEALNGSIGTNPASADLGTVCIGSPSAVDVEVFANADGPVIVDEPPAPSAPFSYATTASFPALLPGNHVGGITLRVSAAPAAVGDFSGSLRLPNNIPGFSLFTLPLSATGAAPGVGATPEVVQFGTIARNSSTSVREVTLSNCSKANVAVTRAFIAGKDTADFVLVSPANPAMTLQPGAHETFLVIMSSHDVRGDRSASLRIEHDGQATEVQLEGTVSDSAGGADRETYYGCQVGAGNASGLAGPVGLAFISMRRRRRRK